MLGAGYAADREHGDAVYLSRRGESRESRVKTLGDRKAYLLRIDPDLWAEIERLAQAELRSVNGQVEFLLREALARRGVVPGASGRKPRRT